MVFRIEVYAKVTDTRALTRAKFLKSLGFVLDSLELADVYTINKSFSDAQIKQIAEALTNPVTHRYQIRPGQLKNTNFDWALEIGFLPGVTDNIGNIAKELIEDLLKVKFKDQEAVFSSQVNLLSGKLDVEGIQKIASALMNPLIQRHQVKPLSRFKKDQGMDLFAPTVKLTRRPKVVEVDLNISDQELLEIGKKGILDQSRRRGPLALELDYLKAIQAHFKSLGRNPSDIELEALAQTWSEHCKHTIFAASLDEIKGGLFKDLIKEATRKIREKKGKKDFCASVFTDNSGAIVFDDQYLITHKSETHNSPSALDPFGGAITGIVGVNRDALGFGLGAKPIANIYGFCLGDPKDQTLFFRDAKLTQQILSPRRIFDGVVAGINAGGNTSGIPTPQGFLVFDDRFRAKPLVFAGTIGLIPRKVAGKPSFKKQARVGDYIVMIGGRVGIDGVHGATFSSESISESSPATAVQIGDPITQKKFSDAIIYEARDKGLFTSITDNGAGGLSSSIGEMARESGGCLVDLEKVPLKYPGLEPWQIWISESQERMTLAVPRIKWAKFKKLMDSRGVEATVIGQFTSSGKCIVRFNKKVIMDLSLEFLHSGLPARVMRSEAIEVSHPEPKLPEKGEINNFFEEILKRLNITSFEFISTQYDHEVQATSILKPLQGKGRVNAEAQAIRPVLNSPKALVLSQGITPYYSEIDSYQMAACSIDTAIRNAVAAGGDPHYLALLDNFCWCSSNEPQRLYQLKRAAQACFDLALIYETPFISGKDSMFNDFNGFNDKGEQVKISIPPTLLISSISVVANQTKLVSLDVKLPGDLVYILGETFEELGGSEYFAMLGSVGNRAPSVDPVKNLKMYQSLFKAIQEDLVASSLAVTRGGLSVALAKASLGGLLGLDISLKKLPGKVSRDDFALFSESQGRILVTISLKNKQKFESIMSGNILAQIGVVTEGKKIVIKGKQGEVVVDTSLEKLAKNYKSTFKGY